MLSYCCLRHIKNKAVCVCVFYSRLQRYPLGRGASKIHRENKHCGQNSPTQLHMLGTWVICTSCRQPVRRCPFSSDTGLNLFQVLWSVRPLGDAHQTTFTFKRQMNSFLLFIAVFVATSSCHCQSESCCQAGDGLGSLTTHTATVPVWGFSPA